MVIPVIGLPSAAPVTVPATVPVELTGTVKVTPLELVKTQELVSATVTTTGPVVARLGTGTTRVLVVQLLGCARVPLNVILLWQPRPLPLLVPKPDPVTVTAALVTPEVGETLVITGVTSNTIAKLGTPSTVTITFPVEPVGGTDTVMLVSLHAVAVAAAPLKVTVLLLPWEAPKPLPDKVTVVPTTPEVGDTVVRVGVGNTVNGTPLPATPAALLLTATLFVVTTFCAGGWASATIEVSLQEMTTNWVDPNWTNPAPWLAPKLLPEIVVDFQGAAEVGDTLAILAVGTIVKLIELLAIPPTVTTTGPLVVPTGIWTWIELLDQFVGGTDMPLKVTVLVPWVAPKPAPLIVTSAPVAPVVLDREVIPGPGVTVKGTPLLPTPPTVTTTGPFVAPDGTAAIIEVALQLVG
jgi:hypothetical protein